MTTELSSVENLLQSLDEDEGKQPIGVVVVGNGDTLPSGLVEKLSERGRVIVIDGRHLLQDSGLALLQAMAPVGFVEDCYAIRSGKGKKSRWNRENRWR